MEKPVDSVNKYWAGVEGELEMFSGTTIEELIGMVKAAEANAAAERALRQVEAEARAFPSSVYCVATPEPYQQREYAAAGAA